MNIRNLAESDLATTLESSSDFGMSITITKQDEPSKTQVLNGKIVYAYNDVEEDTGAPIVVNQPLVTLRVSSLTNVPADGENWYFDIPSSPVEGASIKRFVFSADIKRRGSLSIGFLSYPQREYEDLTT
jgi:hypothetical protein